MSVASRAMTVTGRVNQSLSIIFKDHASCPSDSDSEAWTFVLALSLHVISESSLLSAYALMAVRKSPFLEWLLRGEVDFPERPGRHLSGLTGPNCRSAPFLNTCLSVGTNDHDWLKLTKILPLHQGGAYVSMRCYGCQTSE